LSASHEPIDELIDPVRHLRIDDDKLASETGAELGRRMVDVLRAPPHDHHRIDLAELERELLLAAAALAIVAGTLWVRGPRRRWIRRRRLH
jgi:hypothetical protein